MISERELWACAATILEQHGERAIDHAAGRVADLAKSGDEPGVKTWIAIAERIGRLTDFSSTGMSPH
ncbi:hypothetical protein Q4F19_13390 [Sphingomonas sp. BIUV-7]|uniref:Uncharacterized protein n=2 Tax=Sphingomonas natans TaxID=3063330 RepID=A0ABT8YAL9_9SPHN|nr:hypothetical protein [Sphingomonas sp. BIUV-7]